MLTPRNVIMSSVRPSTRAINGWGDPQEHRLRSSVVRSPVRYRTSGMPSFASVVTTSSPGSPSGRTFPRSSTTSK